MDQIKDVDSFDYGNKQNVPLTSFIADGLERNMDSDSSDHGTIHTLKLC